MVGSVALDWLRLARGVFWKGMGAIQGEQAGLLVSVTGRKINVNRI